MIMASPPAAFITPFLLFVWFFPVVTGIFLLYKLLSQLFTKQVAFLTAILVMFGTNWFYQMLFAGLTANACLFTLFLTIMLLTLSWQKSRKEITLLLMVPVMIAIAWLSFPGIFILLFPAFACLQGLKWDNSPGEPSVHHTEIIVGTRVKSLLFVAGIFVLCIMLRQFSWFYETGARLYYGSLDRAGFPLVPANIHRVLFSVKNGWLVYTPLVAVAFAGYYFLAENNRAVFLPAFLFLLVLLFAGACNPVWFFDSSYGYPNMVETYAILCLPLGYFIHWAWNRGLPARVVMLVLSALFIILNLFQTWQFKQSILVPERMTWPYYSAVFGKTTVTTSDRILLEPQDGAGADDIPDVPWVKCSRVAWFDFEQPQGNDPFTTTRDAHSGKYGMLLNRQHQYSPGLINQVSLLAGRDSTWISATGYFFFTCDPKSNKVFLVMTCLHKGVPYKYRVTDLSDNKFKPGRWNQVNMTYLVPFPVETDDVIQVYFMNYGEQECFIDDFEISLCKPAHGV